MRVDELRELNELDRNELITRALALGVRLNPDVSAASFPTADALRLAIVEKLLERSFDQGRAQQIGADHFAESVLVHAHGFELHRQGLALLELDDTIENVAERHRGEQRMKEADAHFAAARSAAAIAQAGLTAAALGAVGEVLTGMGGGEV